MLPEGDPVSSSPLFLTCMLCIFLVPLAGAGLAIINTGLNRSRSASHAILSSLCVSSVAMLVYFALGFSVQSVYGVPSHTVHCIGKQWSLLGKGPIFLHGFVFDLTNAPLVFLYSMFGVALASVIPISTGAERWKLVASALSTAFLAGVTFPLFSHWVWSGGWLSQLGHNSGLGLGFMDPGGASCIHIVGGVTALSIAWILGPRHGKYTQDGIPNATPGHHAVMVLLGCMLAFVGWLGLNSAGAILFAAAQAEHLILVVVNTALCCASAGITALLITRIRFGRPDASLTANGFICGLVASSATSAFVSPTATLAIGIFSGALVLLSIEVVEFHMKIDDPAASISVHGIGGIWGNLAQGMFANFTPEQIARISNASANSGSGQFLAQLLGVAALIGVILPLAYGANWILNQFVPQRIPIEGERQGTDLFELGSGAYPEFSILSDDFSHM